MKDRRNSYCVLIYVILVFIYFAFCGFGDLPPQKSRTLPSGEWSRDAVSLLRGLRDTLRIPSPDKKNMVLFEGIDLAVVNDGKYLRPDSDNQADISVAELLWSDASNGFAITQSDGGLVGHWYVFLYLFKQGKVIPFQVGTQVLKSFGKRFTCSPPEEAYVAAVKWLAHGKQQQLVAEVPPHSDCPDMGMLRGYVVAVPSGKILKQYTEKQLLSKWRHYLGERLLGDASER